MSISTQGSLEGQRALVTTQSDLTGVNYHTKDTGARFR